MSDTSEVEYAKLSSQIQEVERILREGGASHSNYLLNAFLMNARERLGELRVETTKAEENKKEKQEKENAAIAYAVEKEVRLSAEEKHQYGEFLKLEYFTKSEFAQLNKFYADGGAFDRLSDEGKANISHRVWEGVRRHEYTFDELPENVRKKEAERLYEQCTGKMAPQAGIEKILANDRADFVTSYELGDKRAISAALSRPSFTENVSTGDSQQKEKNEQTAATGTERISSTAASEARNKGEEIRALDGITFEDTDEVTVPAIPPTGSGRARG